VEGERTAEAARRLVGGRYVVLTWSAGVNGWKQTDWTPLSGRNVTICPDADDPDEKGRKPGQDAGNDIAKHLHFIKATVSIVDVSDHGDGWDLADAEIEGWTPEKTFQWINERSKPYEAKTETTASASVQPVADEGPGGSEGALTEYLANSDLSLKMKWSPDGWRVWDGRIWELQKSKIPLPLQIAIRRALVDGLEQHKIESRNIAKLETAGSMKGVADLLAAWPKMQMPTETDPVDLIAFNRGVLNVRSGEWMDHDPSRAITKACPIDPGPDCDYWRMIENHLRTCLGTLYDAVHRFLGSSILGYGGDRRLLWLCGPGGDGKSTLAKILRLCLGDHCAMVAPEVFIEGTRSAHLHELSSVLAGVRLGIALEVQPHRLNWELLKGLSGSDEQQTKRLHQKRFSFDKPPCLVLVSNSTPKPPDLASAQRIILAELRPPDDPREDMMETLKTPGASRDAIAAACAAWLIEGAQEYLEAGLGPIPLCGHVPGPLSRWWDNAVTEGRIDTSAQTWTPLATIKQDLVDHWPAYPGEDLPHDRDLALFLKTKVQFKRTKTERLYRITVVTHGDGSGQVSHARVKGSPDASPPVTSERSTSDLIALADSGDESARLELADRLCRR
jgi:putative DNA primase/helicase